jgi:predicted N-acetyltransferase YhbS
MLIRESGAADVEGILQLHRLAFGRDDEPTLTAALLRDPTAQPALSLAADIEGRIVGHVLFTALHIADIANPPVCALLAPLAVAPTHQGRGVGRSLIEHGFDLLAGRGAGLVFVLGDPGYYSRSGFGPAMPHGLLAPHPVEPAAAWMVRALTTGLLGQVRGTLHCADALAPAHYWRE